MDVPTIQIKIGEIYPSSYFLNKKPLPGPWCAMAPPDFGRSVNPYLNQGGQIIPTKKYWHPRVFRPSDGPGSYVFLTSRFRFSGSDTH